MTFETFDIWSEWWCDLTWPKKTYLLPTYLPTNLREHPQGAILDTCDIWSAVMIWRYLTKTSQELRMLSSVTINCQVTQIVINPGSQLSVNIVISVLCLGTCDIWDTNYNTENWEPGLMKIFVTWQLIVTLDSIRNSCDVYPDITQIKWIFKVL